MLLPFGSLRTLIVQQKLLCSKS
ncbi:hypothetical protein ACFSYS_11330 [Christiangramia antarctica]|uniref:Uncharacterized protein n=1 Tax=Christiangramia antarctica TaxID=2058158 RepID=A0ABW5X5R9_9FLAO